MKKLSHVDAKGKAKMVDVSAKKSTHRSACAFAIVKLSKETFQAVKTNSIKKGDVLAVAKLAGIMGAKKTATLIPLCHNIFISNIDVDLSLNLKMHSIEILSEVKSIGQTGVEMEAMVAASLSALTVYDMCKAMDKSIEITEVRLLSKTGGKSGDYHYKRKKNEL